MAYDKITTTLSTPATTLSTSAVLYNDKVEVHTIGKDSAGNVYDRTFTLRYTSDDSNETVTFVMTKLALSDLCDIINKKK